jgi:hypothetical protein
MKPAKKFKVSICGDPWNIAMLTKSDYQKAIGKGSEAITMYNHKSGSRAIIFRDDYTGLDTIIHEVTHAYFSYQFLGSARIKIEQAEEIFCDFLANRIEQIRNTSRHIYSKLN